MNKRNRRQKALLHKVLALFLCVSMLAGLINLPVYATGTGDETTNLLTNGDFENGSTGWTLSKGSNGAVVVETVDGNSRLSMMATGGSKSQAWAHVSGLQVGQKIIVSGKYYAEKTLNSVKVFAHATNGTTTTNGVFDSVSLSTPTNGEWLDFSLEYTIPEGTYNGIRLRFEINCSLDNNGNTVLFDDLKVCVEAPEQEETGEKLPLLQNGDFEAGKGSWTFAAQSTKSSVSVVEENGNKYLKMYSTGGDLCQAYDHIYGLEPGQTLYITGRYSKEGTTAAEVWAHGSVGATTENGVYEKLSLSEETNGEWVEFSFEYTIPEGKNAIRFRVSIDSTAGATVLFDDLQVYTDATEAALIAKEFREMLAAEEESYPTVNKSFQEGVTDTFPGQPANILINGDFNADNIGTGWTLGTVGSIVAGAGTAGSNALQISGTGAPVVPQIVEITGGAEYYVTYKYKVNEDQISANPTVKFEFFASMTLDGGSYVAEKYVGTGGAVKDGQWHTASGWIRPPANATVMKVMPRMLQSADQTVMFDDITVTMTQAPFALSLVTDQIFYYTGAETGTFTTSVNTNYYPDLASAKVDFQVYDKMEVIWSADDIVSSNGVASATFDLTKLTKKEYPYCVKATIYNADGTPADASVQNIYIYDKPEYIDENGLFIKNGDEPFYPVMGYHVGYTNKENNHYEEAAEAGINLIQIYGSSAKDQLDALHEHGLMGVVTLYKNMKPAGADENIDYVTGVLSEEVVNHPALFGYILMDEVYLALSNPEKDMEASYRLIRMMDKKHPIVTMEAMSTYYDECGKFVDLLFIDPYSNASDKNAYTATQTALNAVNHKKGVYALLCTYGTELTWDRAEDIRNNNYQALIAGADAVGYYAISDGVVKADNTTAALWNCEFDADPEYTVWDKVVEFGTVERDMAFDHFVYGKTPTFNQNLGEDYWYSSWVETDGSIYMIVLGMKDEQRVTAQIPLISTDGNTTVGNFTAEIVAGVSPSYTGVKNFGGNGTLNVTVEDTSAILYKITPTSELPVTEAEIAKHSIILDGTIGINYWTKLSDAVLADENAYMQFIMPDGTINKIPVSQANTQKYEGVDYYTFRCDVAAKEMADDVTAQIISSAGNSAVDVYCVKDYADGVIANDQAGEKLKTLVTNMLHYGAYAQMQFNHNTNKLANSGLDALNMSGVSANTLSSWVATGVGTENAQFKAVGLILETDTVLRLWLSVKDGVTVSVADNEGNPLTATPKTYGEFNYYVDVAKVAAQDLDKVYTVTVSDGTASADVTASALSYCYNVLNKNNTEDLQNVVKALYLYNQAANAYFDNR